MITICELTMFNAGHESFNSAMIYGVHRAYPDENIIFYATKVHLSAVKSNFERNNIIINNISYVEANAKSIFSVIGLIKCFFLLRSIFNIAANSHSNRIFFLSSGSYLMKLAKVIRKKYYNKINFLFVIHGEFETISGRDIVTPGCIAERGILTRLRESLFLTGISHTLRMMFIIFRDRLVPRLDNILMNHFFYRSQEAFHAKESILYDACDQYHYIVYGRHARNYAAKFLDVDRNLITFMDLPIFMKDMPINFRNSFVKFAIFGFGDMEIISNLGKIIEDKNLKSRYEIRNIGPCGIVASYITCSTMCAPHGHFMNRAEMDLCSEDIDMFIITNGKNRYRLSSSGSVLEAISHGKPIIHLDNECSNYFNQPDLPIGIKCRDVEEMAEKMADIIENYDDYREKFMEFQKNILILRDRIRIENQLEDIKSAFTFDDSKQG